MSSSAVSLRSRGTGACQSPKTSRSLVFSPPREVRVAGLGSIGRVPVDLVVRKALSAEDGPACPPLTSGKAFGKGPGNRCHGAPRAQATRSRWTVAQGHGPHRRAQSVGADDHLCRGLAAVGKGDSNAARFLHQRDATTVEVDHVLVERGDQGRVQGGPVDHDQRGAEPGRELVNGGRVEDGSVSVPGLGVRDRTAGTLDRVRDAKSAKGLDRVGPERDAGADLA